MQNDLQSIADDIIARYAKIADDLAAIDAGKALLSKATADADQKLTFTNPLGVVTTARGSNGSSTPYLALNEAKLTDAKRDQLIKAGILVPSVKTTSPRRPSVSISLATKLTPAATEAIAA